MSRDTDGSVLMLVPAAVLVLLVLGAIAVDSAVAFLAQRDLANRTAATANDIAGAALSEPAFYERGGDIELDPVRAARFAEAAFSPSARPAGYLRWAGRAEVAGRNVVVEVEAEVRFVFAGAVPGVARSTTVRARSVASATGG